MRLVKQFTILSSLVASLALAACGGGDDGDGGGTIDPEGTHTQYVVSDVKIPANATEASSIGRDIDGDGQNDNVLGGLLGSLATTADLDIQTPVDEQVAQGGIILLADIQATDLATATGVGMWLFFGDNPDPAPCVDEQDTTCGGHFGGDATFSVASDSPTDLSLIGQIAGGALAAGPGAVSIELALSEGDPLRLDIQEAMVHADVSATDLSNGRITGAVPLDSIQNDILPAVATLVGDLVDQDCTLDPEGGGEPADCCDDADSAGGAVLSFFDKNKDCMVPLEELENDSLIQSTLFNPDIDLDGDEEPDALSIGVSFTAVGATFDLPPGIAPEP